jgi:hypothetical protein
VSLHTGARTHGRQRSTSEVRSLASAPASGGGSANVPQPQRGNQIASLTAGNEIRTSSSWRTVAQLVPLARVSQKVALGP